MFALFTLFALASCIVHPNNCILCEQKNVLKLRKREDRIAEDALRRGDVIVAKESLVASFASGFSAGRALNLFANGSIEVVGTDIAGHNVVVVKV